MVGDGYLNPTSATHGGKGRVAKAAATVASPYGRGGGEADGEGKRKKTPSPRRPACQSPAIKTPRCGVLRVEPDLREGGGHMVPGEISRDEDVSKVVRPRFRMGLKPTALLRHAAKVRLAWRLAQNDTGRDVAKCFPFPPLRATPACHLERAKHHGAVFCESNPTLGRAAGAKCPTRSRGTKM